jgi:hypothetical protein
MRRTLTLILLAALWAPCARALASPDETPEAKHVLSEAEAKAAFVLNFARFTEWPSKKLPADLSEPIRIGVMGEGAVSGELQRLSKNFKIQGHPVEVTVLQETEDALTCQVVYLEGVSQARFQKCLEDWKGQNLLVVGGAPETAKWGAAVAFKPMQARLQFIVNRRAAKAQGISLSAQLLKLAARILD